MSFPPSHGGFLVARALRPFLAWDYTCLFQIPGYRSDKSEGGDAQVQSERHDGERVADGGVFCGGGRVHAAGGDYWSPVGYDYSDSRRRDPVDEGGDGGGEDRDVVQSGWGQAPVELRLPEGFSNGGCEVRGRACASLVLGLSLVLYCEVR